MTQAERPVTETRPPAPAARVHGRATARPTQLFRFVSKGRHRRGRRQEVVVETVMARNSGAEVTGRTTTADGRVARCAIGCGGASATDNLNDRHAGHALLRERQRRELAECGCPALGLPSASFFSSLLLAGSSLAPKGGLVRPRRPARCTERPPCPPSSLDLGILGTTSLRRAVLAERRRGA